LNSVLDNSLVGLALLVSAGYAVTALGPRGVRRRLLAALSRLVARVPAAFGLTRISERLGAASEQVKGACGGCDNCGSEQTPVQRAGAENSAAAEVRVPVAKIGRR
jgi:hypothetical protein